MTLARLAAARGFTMDELAAAVGVKPATLRRVRSLAWPRVRRLAALLDVSMVELLG